MKMSEFVLNVVLVYMMIAAGSCSIIVSVNQTTGVDSDACLQNGNGSSTPCQSLNYAYESSFATFKEMTKLMVEVEGMYVLNRTFAISKPSLFLQEFHLVCKFEERCVFLAEGPHSSFVLGSQINDSLQLSYTITFKNMMFSKFDDGDPAVITGWHVALSVINCSFENNERAAINIADSHVSIYNSSFKNNSAKSLLASEEAFPIGQGSAGGCVGIVLRSEGPFRVVVQGNTFSQNRAIRLSNVIVYPMNEPFLSFTNSGGGLLLVLSGASSFNKIFIKDNDFTENEATIGGAVMISALDLSSYNEVVVDNCTFNANSASNSGGGLGFVVWNQSSNNRIQISNSVLLRNYGRVGGAVKMIFQSHDIGSILEPAVQIVEFVNVSLTLNNGSIASGMHLLSTLAMNSKTSMQVRMLHVAFTDHTRDSNTEQIPGPSGYSGVLLTNGVNVQFEGENLFRGNYESALYVSSAKIYVKGKISFIENITPTSGGGMTVADVGYVVMYPSSEILFLDNFAQVAGGAMYIKAVGYPDTVFAYNPSCFIQYSELGVPPSEWEVKLNFTRNGAGIKGAAIFATTLTACAWNENAPYYSFADILSWNEKNFIYKENYVGDQRSEVSLLEDYTPISTDTVKFLVNPNQIVEVSPGQHAIIVISGEDEVSSSVPVVALVLHEAVYENNSKADQLIELKKKYIFVPPRQTEKLAFNVDADAYEKLSKDGIVYQRIKFIDGYSSFLSNAEVKIKVVPCKPGYIYENEECKCNRTHEAVLRCSEQVVYIKEFYWGYVIDERYLAFMECPYGYCYCNRDTSIDGCAFSAHNPDLQCATGRHGVLCGSCKGNFSLHLLTLECKASASCEHKWWTIFLLVLVTVLVLVGAGLVVYLNPCFSPFMRGIIFFVQMLPYLCAPSVKVIGEVLAYLNVGGGHRMPTIDCFSTDFNSLHVAALGLIYPGLIVLLLIFLSVLNKMQKLNLVRDSPFRCFWILIVAMYKCALETSFFLLDCVSYEGRPVFFYDGNVKCFAGLHLALTIVAVLISLFLVVLLPIFVLVALNGRLNLPLAVRDDMKQGLRDECQWWWIYDLLRRIPLIVIYVFIKNENAKQFWIVVMCILIASLHMQFQPYMDKWANLGEAYLLVSLILLAVVNLSGQQSQWEKCIWHSILSFSVLYCLLVVVCLFVRPYMKCCRPQDYDEIPPHTGTPDASHTSSKVD